MFGTIRKHQNWLWIVIITIIIVTFVIFFSPDAGRLGGEPEAKGEFGSINGKAISRVEFRDGHEEARIAHFMRSGGREWPGSQDEDVIKRDAIFRVFLKHKLKEMDITPSEAAVGRLLRDRLGTYPLASFEQEHLARNGLTLQDFERFMRHEAAIQQLVNVAGVSAKLLNPKEAEILYRKENEQAFTEVALFSASNYLDKVTVDPAAVSNYFSRSMPNYRIPDRIQVSYVEFPVTNYFEHADKQLATVTNLDARIEEIYYQQGTNTFKDTNGVALSADDAKKKIKEEVRHSEALLQARRKASEFGAQLEEQPQAEKLDTFEKFAATKSFPVKVTEPFDRITGLDTNFPPEFRQRAMTLNTNTAVAFSPIVGRDGAYVIALKNRIPSSMPPFEKVQEKVVADYKHQQALDLARKSATNFYATVTNALPQKKAFAAVGKEQNAVVITPPPFSPSTSTLTNLDERLNLRMLQQFAFDMEPGDVTSLIPTAEGSVLIHLRERKPVDEAKVQAELPEFLNRIRLYRHNEAFNQWFRKQIEQAKVVIPQPQAPPGQGLPQGLPQAPPQTRS